MSDTNHKRSSGFGNGLFVGMVIGSIAVLLFTTKKGRKILKVLTQGGFNQVTEWESILDGLELDDDLEDEEISPSIKERPNEMPRKTYLAKS